MIHVWISVLHVLCLSFFFFFNDTATTEIYTLSLHDALPISLTCRLLVLWSSAVTASRAVSSKGRSEEHTSELQSRLHLVCRLLLEKKKQKRPTSLPCSHRRTTATTATATPPRHTVHASFARV